MKPGRGSPPPPESHPAAAGRAGRHETVTGLAAYSPSRIPPLPGGRAGMKPWEGSLSLAFERRGARTVLARNRHHGPILVQSPFHPGDGACHVYVPHPPGGLVA